MLAFGALVLGALALGVLAFGALVLGALALAVLVLGGLVVVAAAPAEPAAVAAFRDGAFLVPTARRGVVFLEVVVGLSALMDQRYVLIPGSGESGLEAQRAAPMVPRPADSVHTPALWASWAVRSRSSWSSR